MKKLAASFCLILFFTLFSSRTSAQTVISGGLFVNQTWTLAGSPYLITDTTTLFPGFTLTIQPGVVLQFDSSVVLNIRGTLNVNGTVTDSVYFIPGDSTNGQPDRWAGVIIDNTQGGTATIQYGVFNHGITALSNVCCWGGGPFVITNCSFRDNIVGLGGYSGIWATVSRCYFGYNQMAVTQADKTIDHCFFEYNDYGLYMTERITVLNSIFCHNGTALWGGRGDLQYNTIIYNGTGVYGFFEGFYNVAGNVISRNDTGIVISGNGLDPNNIICENAVYNAITNVNFNVNVANNCWCTTSPVALGIGIYDAYDDVALGLLQYSPANSCDTSILASYSCDLSVLTGIKAIESAEIISVYPNPAGNTITVESSDYTIRTIELLDISGRLLFSEKNCLQRNTINLEGIAPGVYVIRILTEEGMISRKIVKE